MVALGTPRFRIALALGLLCVFALALGRKVWLDPRTPWLSERAGSAWITFPSAPTAALRRVAPVTTSFRREFELASVSERAELEVRARETASVRLNGVALALEGAGTWKDARRADASAHVRTGRNELEVDVTCERGAPCLWARLECGDDSFGCDESWSASCAGSSERAARLATTPMSAWSADGPGAASALGELRSDELNPRPWDALGERWPRLTACCVAALLFAFVLRRRGAKWSARSLALAVLVSSIALGALFWNNRALGAEQGFDALGHLEYVEHVYRTWSVPYADQGWEMYQPPLYYFAAAGLWKLLGVEPGSAAALAALRMFGWLALCVQLAALAGTLWELFFEEREKLASGLLLAAAIPMQLYLFEYVTNESLAAMWISLALYCAVRILKRADTRSASHAVLGLLLGCALLTKFSALLVACGVVSLLAVGAALRPGPKLRAIARGPALVALVALAVCAPYYANVHERFGSVLVWNLDESTGFAWWQDPGHRSVADYTSFGESLARPLFSALHSVPDALFSTLWNDGMLGGSARVDVRPPWDYAGLAALTVLSAPFSLVLLLGFALALRRWMRDGELGWSLIFGLACVTLAALVSLTLDLPTFAQAKSVYASSVIAAVAVCAGLGFGALASGLGNAGWIVQGIVLGWACASYACFWTDGSARERAPSAALVPARADLFAGAEGDADRALELARLEWERAPDQAWAARNLAFVLLRRGEREAALRVARDGLGVDPWNADLHRLLAALVETSDARAFRAHTELSGELDPGHAPTALLRAHWRREARDLPGAIEVLERARRALRGAPVAERERVEALLRDLSGG
ncbi:MAG: hypothetical protein FJ294_12745 [Planctomycetes bacterium]|nr:hypothetical protein [Planctomycetota bacterium]